VGSPVFGLGLRLPWVSLRSLLLSAFFTGLDIGIKRGGN